MHKTLEAICQALDALASAVKGGWSGEQTFNEAWGWNCPTVTRHDFAAVATRLASDIRAAKIESVEPAVLATIQDFPRRIQHLQSTTVPQFWGGNNGPASTACLATITLMREMLSPLIGWQTLSDPKAVPAQLARRVRVMQAEVDQLSPNKEVLAKQIADIGKAHEIADSLPVDLQALAEARERVVRLSEESVASAEKAKNLVADSEKELNALASHRDEAQKLVDQCEEAYRITTTKGLAAAFDQRATRLSDSMWVWVIGLVAALAIGSILGSTRVEALSAAVSAPSPDWGLIWLRLLGAMLSIGAPVWFAWLATKQIGQRFRLGEDYAFKASVAKAYEGYRKEAARIDPAFEARLFASALTRLDEAPLRLVERDAHGSPWQEFVASEAFQKAINTIPELREAFFRFLRKGVTAFQPGKAKDAEEGAAATSKKE